MQDGMGITMLRRAGIFVAVMSSSYGGSIEKRMKMLKIDHIYTAVKDKAALLTEICQTQNLNLSEVAFVGDDIVDVPPMKLVGTPIAVANAVPVVKEIATYISIQSGGNGAIREIAECIVGTTNQISGSIPQ